MNSLKSFRLVPGLLCSSFPSLIGCSFITKSAPATSFSKNNRVRRNNSSPQIRWFMMNKLALLSSILFFIPLATCHFQLQHPPSRAGEDDEKQATFPCGGYDTITSRTQFPLTGGSIQLQLGHDESLIEVLLALGNNPGDSFNIIWQPTLEEEGLGPFCLQNLDVPDSLNITNGQNATIQVITNSEDNSGLYNCADITFTDNFTGRPPPCRNGTGIHASVYTGDFTNANGTTANDHNNSSTNTSSTAESTGSESTSASTSAPTASETPSMARRVEGGIWALLGALAMGGLALL